MLEKIVEYKKESVETAKRRVSLVFLRSAVKDLPPPRDFVGALKASSDIALIAEIKKASPSKGLIRADFDPVQIARVYQENGASAISVLTEEKYFQGSIRTLQQVRKASCLPLLRKDFIIDEYQIYQARFHGADAVLLIVTLLSASQLKGYLEIAAELALGALVEIHSSEELPKALLSGAEIIGINNRNLKSLKVDLTTTFGLLDSIPEEKIVVSESGINTRQEVLRLKQAGVDAILIGEALMREPDIGSKLRELLGRPDIDN
jgi:indole-3-glycerol phosphate synthase